MTLNEDLKSYGLGYWSIYFDSPRHMKESFGSKWNFENLLQYIYSKLHVCIQASVFITFITGNKTKVGPIS